MAINIENRFNFIEQVVWWEGSINASTIRKHFQLTRQAASKLVNRYKQEYPDNLEYNKSLKAYTFTQHFSPSHCVKYFSSYLKVINGVQPTVLPNTVGFVYEVEAPLRNINPKNVRPILKAIREKLAIDIGYISLSSPQYLDRIIEPHALIFDGLRWHVRAYCLKNLEFRDFVLSRFNAQAIFEGKATKCSSLDDKWHHMVDIIIEPDPRLSLVQQQIIANDYQMEHGQKVIPVRAALLNYLLLKLRVDQFKNTPEEQQIVLNSECRRKITPLLPKPVN